jgi:glycosyltransferase involved in cell wall biosynthesis
MVNSKKRILLNAPDPENNATISAGGGGYMRMTKVLLSTFTSEKYELQLCPHSSRTSSRYYYLLFPFRLLRDTILFIMGAKHADGVHIFLQYRTAIYREYIIVLLAKVMKKPVFIEIRAGVFISWYEKSNIVIKKMVDSIINNAKVIGGQGKVYVDYILKNYNKPAVYLPNYVPHKIIPRNIPTKCNGEILKLLFVGYCNQKKGVHDLITASFLAAQAGIRIKVTLIGKEEEKTSLWLNNVKLHDYLQIERWGYKPHDIVLSAYNENDVFIFPTHYAGEGHPNVINEAMMMGMVIISTKHGFIESILDEDTCYFINKNDPIDMKNKIIHVYYNREDAQKKAYRAHQRLKYHYTDQNITPILESVYSSLIE